MRVYVRVRVLKRVFVRVLDLLVRVRAFLCWLFGVAVIARVSLI